MESKVREAAAALPESALRDDLIAATNAMPIEVSNVIQLAAQYQLEVACLVEDYHHATGARRELYARLVILSLYASTHAMRGFSGKGFRAEMSRVLGSAILDHLNSAAGGVDRIFEQTRKRFADIRNKTAAHRDPAMFIRELQLSPDDQDEAIGLAIEALAPLREIEQLCARYTAVSGEAFTLKASEILTAMGDAQGR